MSLRHCQIFRFKLYLKSNLERLYRNTDGEIVVDEPGWRSCLVAGGKKEFSAAYRILCSGSGKFSRR